MSAAEFTRRKLEPVGKTAFRLGISCTFGIDPEGLSAAFERGVNYLFWTKLRTGKVRDTVRAALKKDRERFVVVAAPSVAFFGGNVRRGAERSLKALGTDYLDVLHLPWMGRASAWTASTLEEVARLKSEGKVRAMGISIHDRPRAAKLAQDPKLGVLMIRYNAAHPGAERDIFPSFAQRRPAVVAYTATSWRKLLRPPSGWKGPAMTAGDCYRFCLSSPNVDVTLFGPANRAQLEEDLAALEKGPLTAEEDRWMREYGRAVRG